MSVPKRSTLGNNYSKWLFLIGHLPEHEALNGIQAWIPEQYKSSEEWLHIIKRARSHANNISGRSQVKPEIRDLPAEFAERFLKLQKEPIFQEYLINMKAFRFALIEISKIHIFKPDLSIELLKELEKDAPEPEDWAQLVKFCLPLKEERKKKKLLTSYNTLGNTFLAIADDNPDFRILGNFEGEDPNGRSFSAFAYGFGHPAVSVVEYNGFHFLKNGSHRALALLRKGHKFMPCLLMQTDNYAATGGTKVGFFSSSVALSDKSPIIADFNSKAAVIVPRRKYKIVISVHAEVQLVPL